MLQWLHLRLSSGVDDRFLFVASNGTPIPSQIADAFIVYLLSLQWKRSES